MGLSKKWAPYLFISPFYLLFAVFTLYPLLFALYISFTEWNGIGDAVWLGMDNYVTLFKDEVFLQSLKNGVIIFIMYVPLLVFLALLLAAILNTAFVRLKGLFRTVYFVPYVTSLVAVGFTFQMIFGSEYGYLNQLLGYFGVHPIDWMGTVWGSRLALCALVIWRWLGYNMVIMLSGLQNIPADLYEAATIDGAGTAQRFFKITIPLMKPVLLFTFILSTLGTFSLFAEPLILTKGGPINTTISPVMYVYNQSFSFLKFGYASAMAYVFFILMFVMSLIQMKIFGKED
jgi:lactose/L-arabinose transport system permease protein